MEMFSEMAKCHTMTKERWFSHINLFHLLTWPLHFPSHAFVHCGKYYCQSFFARFWYSEGNSSKKILTQIWTDIFSATKKQTTYVEPKCARKEHISESSDGGSVSLTWLALKNVDLEISFVLHSDIILFTFGTCHIPTSKRSNKKLKLRNPQQNLFLRKAMVSEFLFS